MFNYVMDTFWLILKSEQYHEICLPIICVLQLKMVYDEAIVFEIIIYQIL